jgi:hypothetical protein
MFCRLQNTVFSRMPTSGSSLVRQPLVIPLQNQAIRISPRDPYIGVGYSASEWVHPLQDWTRSRMRETKGIVRNDYSAYLDQLAPPEPPPKCSMRLPLL